MKNGSLVALLLAAVLGCTSPGPRYNLSKPTVIDSTSGFHEGVVLKTFIRKNIYRLAPNDPDLVAYQRGVAIMKSRPANDPTSWTYQAAIHGTNTPGSYTGWNTCQHGTYYFLSWHRMYLYFFERIVRKASGYPEFSLPYWNYSDAPAEAVLPSAFRDPADATNSLYLSGRESDINQGDPLQPSSVDYESAFSETLFSVDGNWVFGFGGLVSPPRHASKSTHGELETYPHDHVHDDIGGLMGDPNTAAQDPIFWLHHANIDRLWVNWLKLGGGRANPTDDENWMNTAFTFFDENGVPVTLTGKQILDTEGQLHYKYDDWLLAAEAPYHRILLPVRDATKLSQGIRTDHFKAGILNTVGARTDIPLALAPSAQFDRFLSSAVGKVTNPDQPAPARVFLQLDGINYTQRPTGIFEVYINLPAGEKPLFHSAYYAGNISLFALGGHHPDTTNAQTGGSYTIDITHTLRALQLAHVAIDHLTVSIIHKGASPAHDDRFSGELEIAQLTLSDVQ